MSAENVVTIDDLLDAVAAGVCDLLDNGADATSDPMRRALLRRRASEIADLRSRCDPRYLTQAEDGSVLVGTRIHVNS